MTVALAARGLGELLIRSSRSNAKRLYVRAVLIAIVVAIVLGGGASSASAVIVHLASGATLSYQPVAGAAPTASPFDAFFSNLEYSGGPVMPSNTNYAVYWAPSGAPAYPADYKPGVNQFFEDLAHDSGGHENVDSVATQYNDTAGEFASYNSHFGGALVDTDPYPANGCARAPICLTDAQIQEELENYVSAHKLPTGLAYEYFMLTPKGVEDCFEAAGGACSAGTSAPERYCAYHGYIPIAGSQIVYSNDPYVTGNAGCDDGERPNGKSSDGVLIGGLSHEHNESTTDPEPNNAWTDWVTGGSTGYENGDKCRNHGELAEFGTPLGEVEVEGKKYKYNQVINGHKYWYQQEWSNQGHKCLQRFTLSGVEPTATFTSKPAAGVHEATFDATGSTAPGGVAHYGWRFLDGNVPVETTAPTVSHKFPSNGPFGVGLTVFASDGTSIGTSRIIEGGNVVSAPTVVTKAQTSVTPTSATLNATVNPNGPSVSECEFEYGTTTAYGSTAPCSSLPGPGSAPVAVSTSVAGLTPNTTYHFRISATTLHGTSKGSDEAFPTPPSAPTVVTGTALAATQTGATLNATVNPNGGKVSACKFEYGTTAGYGSSVACSSLPGPGESPVPVSSTIAGLSANTTYHFRISATNPTGTTKGSDESFKALPNPPATVTEAASAVTQTGATVNATVNPNGGEVSECSFEYGPTTSYGKGAPCVSPPGSGESPVAVSASVTGLAPNTAYHVRISATNLGGTSKGNDETLKTSEPTPPAVLTGAASVVTQTSATLNATVNPNGGLVEECTLEYGTTSSYGLHAPCSSLPGQESSPVAVSASVSSLIANTIYHFRIVAKSSLGTREGSDQAFTTLSSPVTVTTTGPLVSPLVSSLVKPAANSNFKSLSTALTRATGAITFTESVGDPGTFSWLLTFQNGKFGVFAASNAKCKKGFIKLNGRCRPSAIIFAKGSKVVAAPGTVSFTVKPSASASKALRNALKHKRGVPVTATLTFQSSLGGSPVSHTQSVTVKLKR